MKFYFLWLYSDNAKICLMFSCSQFFHWTAVGVVWSLKTTYKLMENHSFHCNNTDYTKTPLVVKIKCNFNFFRRSLLGNSCKFRASASFEHWTKHKQGAQCYSVCRRWNGAQHQHCSPDLQRATRKQRWKIRTRASHIRRISLLRIAQSKRA